MSTNYIKKGRSIKAWFEINSKYRMQTESLDPVILADKIEFAINNYGETIKKAENTY